MSLKGCEDDLMLQQFLDEELCHDAAEIVLYHVEKCVPCGERLQNLKIVKAFCREQLGREDEFESEFTQNALLRVRSRLSIQKVAAKPQGIGSSSKISTIIDRLRSKIAGFGFEVKWSVAIASAALVLVCVGLIAWLAISPSFSISASEILSESERRTLIWQNQPDKVLHWVMEQTLSNHPSFPDGKYRSLYWQNNTSGKSLRLIRRFNENGVLVWASWTRADGAEVIFKHFPEDEIKIFPATDALRAYADQLDEKSRKTLEHFISSSYQVAPINPETNLQLKRQSLDRWFNKGSVEIIQTADIGKVFRVRRKILPQGTEKFARLEMEYDIAADSFLRQRLYTVRYYADGKTAVENSRLLLYKEVPVTDFNANDLSKEIEQAKRIVQITPEEVLKTAQRFEEVKKSYQEPK